MSNLLLGVPGAPKGPLDISDVRKDGCKLKWKKPEDNGGTPIEYYEVSKSIFSSPFWGVSIGRTRGT